MVTAATNRYTPAEYLQREEQSEVRHELIDGEILAVAGASANHNRIAVNFCRLFPLEVEGKSYEVFMSDMRLWLPEFESYTYPDVMVVAEAPRFTDEKQTALMNPCLIVEILSTSTETYDKSAKFRLYRSIPEFQEYLLVDQTAYRVEQFTKVEPRRWLMTEWVGDGAVMPLQSAPVRVGLRELYQRVAIDGGDRQGLKGKLL